MVTLIVDWHGISQQRFISDHVALTLFYITLCKHILPKHANIRIIILTSIIRRVGRLYNGRVPRRGARLRE